MSTLGSTGGLLWNVVGGEGIDVRRANNNVVTTYFDIQCVLERSDGFV